MSDLKAWSYSRLRNFETCPHRYLHYDVLKDVSEPESAELRAGNAMHKAFENRLVHDLPLTSGHLRFETMLAKIVDAPGVIFGEQRLAITQDMQPDLYFGARVWFRTIVDLMKLRDDTAVVFDWKDGKAKDDPTQLMLMAAAIFVHYPQVQQVKTGLIFINHDYAHVEHYGRDDQVGIWNEILPRVKSLLAAHAVDQFPPKPSGLCKRYCAVKSCAYHGLGR